MPETVPPASGTNRESDPSQPAFIRLPKVGERCQWTGLSRGTMNYLILGPEAPVKSIVISQPGATRGIRLIHFQSLMNYLDGLVKAQNGNPIHGKGGTNND
ncbi:MAG: hypothetical protein KDN20_15355 [Verrucomicrobiae bacterium]|nr:hypothetical protein [Verrucomicrobiae bacterium]